MPQKLKLIIFDLDGTLVNAYKAVSQSLNFALKKSGLNTVDDEIIKRRVGWGDRNLLQNFVPDTLLEKTLAIYRKHHLKALPYGTLFMPGAKKLLTALSLGGKNGYKFAVASNRPTMYSLVILKHLKIYGQFDYVLCADKVKRGKPAPDILLQILKKLKVRAHEAVYIGDMTIDIQAGHKAKIKTIGVATGSSKRRDISRLKPYRVIQNVWQVKGILKEFND